VKRAIGILIILLFAGLNAVQAQQEAVVYAVLFYSPSCPHCHTFIQEDLPPMQEQFGDQLVVLYVNVSTPEGMSLFREAGQVLDVSDKPWGSVPAMVIGTTVMIGGAEIPAMMPALVANGLANGGIDIPPIPTLQEIFYQQMETTAIEDTVPEAETWQQRFENDVVANSLALLVLLLLVGSVSALLAVGIRGLQTQQFPAWLDARPRWIISLSLMTLTALLAFTLVLDGEGTPVLLALGITMLLITAALIEAKSVAVSRALLPIIAVVGLLVAGYLTYVETGNNEAVCGAVGNCNVVQQSEYAELFGVLPIGVLGLIGYGLILAAWGLSMKSEVIGQSALLVLTFIGVAFSIYLTFLEPFVIGATCVWCLTSALVMLMLLYLQAPSGWRAVQVLVTHRTSG
jgi:uncharacterized membrane protein